MEIYIDVYFIINFIYDFLLLVLCDFRFSKPLKKALGATIGSLYACLFVFNLPEIFFSSPIKMLILGLMCFISFYPCTIKLFFEKCVLFLVISIFFCGVVYASPLLLDTSDIPCGLLTVFAFFITRLTFFTIKNKLYQRKHKLIIKYNDKSVTIFATIDTGNTLKDPVSNNGVLIVNEEILKELFSPSLTQKNLCEFVNPEDFRIIPYKTISNSGITYGFIPDKLYYENREIKNAIIAVSPSPISSDALINPQLI